MVNFGLQLLQSRHMPWALEYLEYDRLKEVLDRESYANDLISTNSRTETSSEFISLLYMQTEKISLFVIQELGRISLDLTDCRQDLARFALDADHEDLQSLEEKYVRVGENSPNLWPTIFSLI